MSSIIQFDQHLLLLLNGSNSLYWDNFWMCITQVGTWIIFYISVLYILLRSYSPKKVLLILLFVGLAILLADQVASGICKPLFQRYRPSREPLLEGQVAIVEGYRGGKYGFMSSHAANGFAICTFLSLVVRHRLFTWTIAVYACITSFSRIYLGVHYPGDILCGALWGTISGLLSYAVYNYTQLRYFKRRIFFSDAYTRSGIMKDDVYVPMCIFLLTIIVVLTYSTFRNPY